MILALVGPSLPTRVTVWGAAELSAQTTYRPGQRVEARWRSGPDSPPRELWEPAVMIEPSADGQHLIRFDTNDLPQRLEAALVRPAANAPALRAYRVGDRVLACSGDYSCLEEPGTVTQVGEGARAAQWEVRFASGLTKWRNGYTEIKDAPATRGRNGDGNTAVAPAPAPPPTAPRALPAAVPTGRYYCTDAEADWRYRNQIGGGVDQHQMVGYSASTGVLDVIGPASYRWGRTPSDQQPGAFRYARGTGRITFGAGPYKPSQFSGEFGWNESGGTAVITLTYKGTRGESKQWCVRR